MVDAHCPAVQAASCSAATKPDGTDEAKKATALLGEHCFNSTQLTEGQRSVFQTVQWMSIVMVSSEYAHLKQDVVGRP